MWYNHIGRIPVVGSYNGTFLFRAVHIEAEKAVGVVCTGTVDPKVLFLGRDSGRPWIGRQSAFALERCCVWRRGRERVAGSVSLTYGAVVRKAANGYDPRRGGSGMGSP